MIDHECQIYSCTEPAAGELVLTPDAAVWVCERHNTARARDQFLFRGLSNVSEYGYKDRLVLLSCVGDPPVTHTPAAALEPEIRSVFETSSGRPYILPCIRCRKDFVLDWTGKVGVPSIACGDCKRREEAQPAAAGEQLAAEPPSEAPSFDPEPRAAAAEPQLSPKDDTASFDPGAPPWHPGAPVWETIPEQFRLRVHEHFEERAAIAEYDGQMPRGHAEHFAYNLVLDGCRAAGWIT